MFTAFLHQCLDIEACDGPCKHIEESYINTAHAGLIRGSADIMSIDDDGSTSVPIVSEANIECYKMQE